MCGMSRERNAVQVFGALMLIAILGTAAALWSDNLKIRTEVYTGDVDVEFIGSPQIDDPEFEGKDVGQCMASFEEVEDEDLGNPRGNNDTDMNITITNAYPSYQCKIYNVGVNNTGTVPVKLHSYLVVPPSAVCTFNMSATPPVWDCDMDGDGDLDLNIWGSFISMNNTHRQLHPGESTSFTVELHVKQGAPENSTMWFQVKILAHQWNEEP